MDMQQIECFLAVAKNLSFTNASYDISISQSSISKKIASLEKELDTSLFYRTTQSVELTPSGKLLLEHGEKLMNIYNQILLDIKNCSNLSKGKLKIGSIYFSPSTSLIPLIAEFSKAHPEIILETVDGTTTPLIEALLASTIDVAFVSSMYLFNSCNENSNFRNDKRFISHSISKDPYFLVVNRLHPLASSQIIDYQDIKDEKFIGLDKKMDVYHKAFNEVFENENIKPNIIMVSSSVRDALTLISKNIGVAILSSKVASNCPDIALVPLKRPLIRDTQMLIRNEKDTCLSTKLFFDFIKNAYT